MIDGTDNSYDVAIIGGGPAGLSCALYCARARLSTVVFDKSPGAGALALTARITNYPGVHGGIAGVDLLGVMREQAIDFGAQVVHAAVLGVDFQVDPKQLYTTDGVYEGRTVVIATGAMGRRQRVPGEQELLGRGVSYCAVCDAPFLEDKAAAVVGDTDTALDEALYLARFASKVYLISPRAELHAAAELVQAVSREPRIESLTGWRLVSILGDESVSGIEIESLVGDKQKLAAEGVFIMFAGAHPATDFLQGALPLSGEGCVVVDSEHETIIPGVYAVGDVLCAHVKQAVVAAAEGVVAALAIDKHLNKREKIRADY